MKVPSEGGFLIAKIHQLSERIFNSLLKERGIDINPAQGRILFSLWQKDNIPIRELSEKTRLEKSTLTAMLDRLEEAGLIRRIPSSEDRRVTLVQRTPRDHALQERYNDVSQSMTGFFYRDFSEVEIVRFEKNLNKILNNLIEYEESQ